MDAFMAARAVAVGVADLAEFGPPPAPPPADPNERFRTWAHGDDLIARTSLADTLGHLQTFWDRRERPNVVLFHYRDMLDDLPREIRRLADVLQIPCTDSRVQELAAAASIEAMRSRADTLIPDGGTGCFLSNERFFRAAGSGQWREGLDDETLVAYADRVAALAPPDLATWAHKGWHGASSHSDEPCSQTASTTAL
jgi:aryl sulfotransferase